MSPVRLVLAALGAAVLAAGCASVAPAPRTTNAPAALVEREPAPAAPREAPVAGAPLPTEAVVATPPRDTWTRIRDAFAFASCDRARVVAEQRRFLRAPDALARQIERAMPLIALVFERLEARGLPGEYVFLPLIESGYAPIDAGRGPTGIWQLMPRTARGLGLAIDASYDGRLDTIAATEAAVALLALLGERFDGDWRLATMAYNAGEFRVRGAMRRSDARPVEHERLVLPAITHAHLAKLEALACIARDSERFRVRLVEPLPAQRLASVALEAPLDLMLAAALAGFADDEFRRLNRAHRGRVAEAGRRLVVRADTVARFEELLARVPPAARAAWRRTTRAAVRARDGGGPGVDAELLAAINAGAPPGAWIEPGAPAARPAAAADTDVHTVRAGESLWLIARRYGTSVAALLEANRLDARALLRPGDLLRIARPARSATR